MPAKNSFTSFISGISGGLRVSSRRTKRVYIWTLPVIAAIFVLTACTSGNSNTSSSTAKTDSMSPALELALGTLKLEGTEQAVDSKAAAQLLPLWQLLDELDNNASAAPAEFTAVTEEIQLTMTSAQIQAIDDMQLTQEDVAAASQTARTSTIASSSAASGGGQNVSAGVGPIMGGNMPAGGMPLDGGGPMPGGNNQNNAASSKAASSTSQPTLIQQVIRLLQTKVQG